MTWNQATELVEVLKKLGWGLPHFYRANNSPHWETYHVAAKHPQDGLWEEFKQPYGPDQDESRHPERKKAVSP